MRCDATPAAEFYTHVMTPNTWGCTATNTNNWSNDGMATDTPMH